MNVLAIIQARMSSQRFPGKVLAPFCGVPIIRHVVEAASHGVGESSVVVATSDQPSDDPLVAYLAILGTQTFRGPLDDVLERFRLCARAHPSDWIIRICADSPVLDPSVLVMLVESAGPGLDIVTTAFPHRQGSGLNAELVRTSTLLELPDEELTAEDREHVTRFFYRHPERFTIRSLPPVPDTSPGADLSVDTVDDLRRLESLCAP